MSAAAVDAMELRVIERHCGLRRVDNRRAQAGFKHVYNIIDGTAGFR
jgi:hypothetical protein